MSAFSYPWYYSGVVKLVRAVKSPHRNTYSLHDVFGNVSSSTADVIYLHLDSRLSVSLDLHSYSCVAFLFLRLSICLSVCCQFNA